MDPRLKVLLQNLGDAINSSLSDSGSIAEAIGEIKGAGYDIHLILELTILFDDKRERGRGVGKRSGPSRLVSSGDPPQFKLTVQDRRFLEALKIAEESGPES